MDTMMPTGQADRFDRKTLPSIATSTPRPASTTPAINVRFSQKCMPASA
jgi:hypothetical protein